MLIHLKSFSTFALLNESVRVEKIPIESYENETVISLPYTNLIEDNRQAFLKKIVKISKDLGIKPIWLMHTIFHESRFDPKKSNRMSGGVGLISFLPTVLKNFINAETGKTLTANEVLQMSNIDQLDLVKSFYDTWFDRMKIKKPIIPGDFAAITFYPAVIKKDLKWEFPEYVYEKNSDMFKDFPSATGRTKKDYYDYIDQIFRGESKYDDANDHLLGNFSGAIAEPGEYSNKKPLEYYKDIIMNMEDPALAQQIQDQDIEDTEKHKQVDK